MKLSIVAALSLASVAQAFSHESIFADLVRRDSAGGYSDITADFTGVTACNSTCSIVTSDIIACETQSDIVDCLCGDTLLNATKACTICVNKAVSNSTIKADYASLLSQCKTLKAEAANASSSATAASSTAASTSASTSASATSAAASASATSGASLLGVSSVSVLAAGLLSLLVF